MFVSERPVSIFWINFSFFPILYLAISVLTDTQCRFCWVGVVGSGRVNGLHGSGGFSCKVLQLNVFDLVTGMNFVLVRGLACKPLPGKCDIRFGGGAWPRPAVRNQREEILLLALGGPP